MTPSAYGVAGENVVTVIAIDEAGNKSTVVGRRSSSRNRRNSGARKVIGRRDR